MLFAIPQTKYKLLYLNSFYAEISNDKTLIAKAIWLQECHILIIIISLSPWTEDYMQGSLLLWLILLKWCHFRVLGTNSNLHITLAASKSCNVMLMKSQKQTFQFSSIFSLIHLPPGFWPPFAFFFVCEATHGGQGGKEIPHSEGILKAPWNLVTVLYLHCTLYLLFEDVKVQEISVYSVKFHNILPFQVFECCLKC